jgi:hypothetical protein
MLFTACGEDTQAGPPQAGGSPRGGTPQAGAGCASGGGSAVIDWTDFIRLDGVTYQSNYYEKGLAKSDVGEPIAEVRCKISDVVTDPEYDLRDGDAAYLEPGSTIYSVRGYPSSFRIAAFRDGQWLLYEPDTHPGAEVGADLLDLEGRIRYIGINSSWNGTKELARIDDRDEVERLVEIVLSAPVDQARNYSDADLEDQVFIEFGFDDGTRSIRAFGPKSGQLARGIMTPPEFAEAVEMALQQRS